MSSAVPTFAVRCSGIRKYEGREYGRPELLHLTDDETEALQVAERESRKGSGRLVLVDSYEDRNYGVAFLNGKRIEDPA